VGVVLWMSCGSQAVDDHTFSRHLVDVHRSDWRPRLASQLATLGLVTFAGVHSPTELLALARSIGEVHRHRDSDRSGVTTIANDPDSPAGPGYLAFTAQELVPHTDGSSLAHPPPLVLLLCAAPATYGGQSLVVDGRVIYNRMRLESPAALRELTRPGCARFGGENGYVGSVFEYRRDSRDGGRRWVSVRFRLDGLSIFDSSASAILPQFLETASTATLQLQLQSGQGYVVQNGRWLHGRRAHGGPRCFYRVLVTPRLRDARGQTIPYGFQDIDLPGA
jgi:hypothetical protein